MKQMRFLFTGVQFIELSWGIVLGKPLGLKFIVEARSTLDSLLIPWPS